MSHTGRGPNRCLRGTPALQPRRTADGSLVVGIPASLAGAALRSNEVPECVAFLVASALDTEHRGQVEFEKLRAELKGVMSEDRVRHVLNGDKMRRYGQREGRFFRLTGRAGLICSFEVEVEVLPRTDGIALPLVTLNTRARRGAALLASVLATARAKPRSQRFISRFTGVDRGTIYRWLRDPIVSRHMLRCSPTWRITDRRRRPNRWLVPASREGVSMQLRRGLGSRTGETRSASQGIRPLKIHFGSEAEMLRELRARRRKGIDIVRELLLRGELLVGEGRELRPYFPEDLLPLLGIRSATLPQYYWDTDQEEKEYWVEDGAELAPVRERVDEWGSAGANGTAGPTH